MQVKSPVGSFPLRIVGVGLDGGEPKVKTAMGAWQSEVRIERADLPLLALLGLLLMLVFGLGHAAGARAEGRR